MRLTDEELGALEEDARKATFAFRMSPQQGLALLREVRQHRAKEPFATYEHAPTCHARNAGRLPSGVHYCTRQDCPGCTCGLASALEEKQMSEACTCVWYEPGLCEADPCSCLRCHRPYPQKQCNGIPNGPGEGEMTVPGEDYGAIHCEGCWRGRGNSGGEVDA